VRTFGGLHIDPADTVIVGDTPLDVAVAIAGGARSVAVATGSHGVEVLRDSGANVVLQDLSDIDVTISAFGLVQ
jgi:phosphoglycolate phosphatase-like HAD superfamily hydrolase